MMFDEIFNKLSPIYYDDDEIRKVIDINLGDYPGQIVTSNSYNLRTHKWPNKSISLHRHDNTIVCYAYSKCNKCSLLVSRHTDFDILTGCLIYIEKDWYPNFSYIVPDCNAFIMQQALE